MTWHLSHKQVLGIGFKQAITLAAICILGSCTSNDMLNPNLSKDNQQVAINLQLGVNNIASREMTSWDAAQQVNDMRLYLFRCPQSEGKEGTYTYYIPQNLIEKNESYYTVGSFDNQTPYLSDEHGGKYETHIYGFTPTLESGYYYKILAVGRDDKYSSEPKIAESTFTSSTTTFEDASLSLLSTTIAAAQNKSTLDCTELFTGKLQEDDKETGADDAILVTEDNKEFDRSITLKRSVAGLMMYVQHIPSIVEDNSSTNNNRVVFTPTTLTLEATAIGTDEYLASKTATSTQPLKYQILASIDLSASNGWTNNKDTHLFTRPADTDKGWLENSYMVTNFMMPTSESNMDMGKNATSQANQQKVTFYLHYTDGTHHHYDNIKLQTDDGDKWVFPIEANHLYTIGEQSKDANIPYDLKTHEPVMTDITLEIEPAFDKRHDFTVE